MPKNPIIEVDEVSKEYSGSLLALDRVSFKIYEGELVSIVGPNGCGKTTLIYLLSNLLKPTSGKMTVFNNPASNSKLTCGIIFQDYRKSLFNWLTVRGNVEFPLEIKGVQPKERKKLVEKYLKMMKLEKFEHNYPSELSGGMQQKVAIARALVYNPDILLLDEPFASLDTQTRLRMQSELIGIWKVTKKTMVLVTHNIDEAIYTSNRIILLTRRPGKVKKELKVNLPYPRKPDIFTKTEFLRIRSTLWRMMREEIDER